MKKAFAAGFAVLLVAACQTPTERAEAKPDPRQGKEVSQICFNQQIRNWKANDNRSVIVTKGMNEDYKLDLIGTCNPQDAFTTIGLVSRVGGGTCLSSGDRLVTDSRFDGGPCSIQRIYEWNADAKAAEPPPPA